MLQKPSMQSFQNKIFRAQITLNSSLYYYQILKQDRFRTKVSRTALLPDEPNQIVMYGLVWSNSFFLGKYTLKVPFLKLQTIA